MNFMIYDIALLVIFVACVSIFLYRKRKNLKREGLMFLYRTKLGMKIIEKIGTKYARLLRVLSYISIVLGFVLMAGILYFIGKIAWIYIFQTDFVKLVKVPPIMPLVPYLPQIFKLDFLPAFYFIYWIIIIAIVAITHEFAHGIFMKRYGIKIKATGFGFFPYFFPAFPVAFVEQDEKSMENKKIFPQMAVLSAGTFANTLIAIFFFGILLLFFTFAFSASGVVFDTYSYSAVTLTSISIVNGIQVANATHGQILNLLNDEGFNEIEADNNDYIITKKIFEQQENNQGEVLLYDNAPAIKSNLSNVIVKLGGTTITGKEQLSDELSKYNPGDKVVITTLEDDAFIDEEIVLGENPQKEGSAYLGIGFVNQESSGILGKILKKILFFKESNVYYKPNFFISEFIYNLIWWLVLISLSVALFNMLPVGIFDGGKFFYLTILAITKKEKIAKKLFSLVTYLFLLLLFVVMVFWGINIFLR